MLDLAPELPGKGKTMRFQGLKFQPAGGFDRCVSTGQADKTNYQT